VDRVGAADVYRFSPSYVPSLRRALGDAVHLIAVVADGRTTAAGIYFEAEGILGYHLGATRTEALAQRPSKLMMDTAWRWGQRRGNRALHLGGGVGGSAEGSLFHFKAGFSPLRHPFQTARMVLDAKAYDELCAPLGGITGQSDHAGFFPAYRAPQTQQDDRATGREGGPWLLTVT
jgi:hypothetical protein